MTHAARARKERGAKIVAIDIYHNGTMQQADLALCLRPGTDGALACAVMHVLFRDGYANWPYLEKYTDCPRELEAHLRDKTPEWASAITGLTVAEIETFAKMVGTTPKTYFRLGYGFARQRNGAHNMHAALCIPSVTGAWLHEGGGGFHNNGAIYHWNKSLIEGLDVADPDGARARPVAHRPGADGRSRRPQGRPAGHGAVHPEHEPGAGGARAAQGEGRVRARGPVRLRARAVHDGDGEDGRRGAAGHHVPGARRRLPGRRPPVHHAGPEADRAAGRVPLQPRCDLRAGQARRRRASGLRHDPARDHRLDAAEVGLGHAGRAGREEVDRLPARVRHGALHQGLPLSRQEVPLQARLAERAGAAQQRHPHRARRAAPARPLGRDREGGREAPVPACHQPVARLSQLVVQRDADQPGAARQAARQGASRRSGQARHRRRRARAHGQRARRDRAGRPRRFRACSAAWSSSRASPPTITSRAARASTR